MSNNSLPPLSDLSSIKYNASLSIDENMRLNGVDPVEFAQQFDQYYAALIVKQITGKDTVGLQTGGGLVYNVGMGVLVTSVVLTGGVLAVTGTAVISGITAASAAGVCTVGPGMLWGTVGGITSSACSSALGVVAANTAAGLTVAGGIGMTGCRAGISLMGKDGLDEHMVTSVDEVLKQVQSDMLVGAGKAGAAILGCMAMAGAARKVERAENQANVNAAASALNVAGDAVKNAGEQAAKGSSIGAIAGPKGAIVGAVAGAAFGTVESAIQAGPKFIEERGKNMVVVNSARNDQLITIRGLLNENNQLTVASVKKGVASRPTFLEQRGGTLSVDTTEFTVSAIMMACKIAGLSNNMATLLYPSIGSLFFEDNVVEQLKIESENAMKVIKEQMINIQSTVGNASIVKANRKRKTRRNRK